MWREAKQREGQHPHTHTHDNNNNNNKKAHTHTATSTHYQHYTHTTNLHVARPRALGQLALREQLGKLRGVVGVGDAAGAQAVADAEADVVGGADVEDVVPVRVAVCLFWSCCLF